MNGIFLHTSWRSSGTWLWEKLRSDAENMGFYEPLHEFLPAMSTRRIAGMNPANWQSGHPHVARPYFAEYAPLLRPTLLPGFRKNLPLADTAFAFDRYFLGAEASHEPLRVYIASLCAAAAAAGRQPVLKFARSQGRIAWFAKNFPAVTHAVMIRQPWTQFRSGWRCMVEDRNPYFAAAPFMVLERNAAEPDVAALIAALDLPITPRGSAAVLPRLKNHLRGIWEIDALTIYKAGFALWFLNAMRAAPTPLLMLDGDASSAEIAAPFGLKLAAGQSKRPALKPLAVVPQLKRRDLSACHNAALAAFPGLDPVTRQKLVAWIDAAEASGARDLPPCKHPARERAPRLVFTHRARESLPAA